MHAVDVRTVNVVLVCDAVDLVAKLRVGLFGAKMIFAELTLAMSFSGK